MLVSTEGIVLKQFPYSESSLIIRVFTRDFGLVSFIIKGARGKKSQNNASILRPMNQISFSFYNKENKSLKSFKECQLLFAPDGQNFGIYKSSICMFIIELLNQTISEESEIDELKYNFISNSYQYLKNHPIHSCFYLSFMYQYLYFLGFGIELDTPLDYLTDYHLLQEKIHPSTRKDIYNKLEIQYLSYVPNFKSLQSIKILEEILH